MESWALLIDWRGAIDCTVYLRAQLKGLHQYKAASLPAVSEE